MKKTGATLVKHALEQIGVKYTFGIPGVHNTEIYDELNKSKSIKPTLVTHELGGAFMADAISRTSDSIGTLVIVPAAGASHAASGIGEAFLDGVPMMVISGGVRSDSQYEYQLHDMDQHTMMSPITKGTWKIEKHEDIIPTIYEAYNLANEGEPGPVFIEVPVNIQLDSAEIDSTPNYKKPEPAPSVVPDESIKAAADLLLSANNPGLFLGWGSVGAAETTQEIADLLQAPVATTLQGLSAFPANHPLHTGMSFGRSAVPAAENAFAECDAMLAVGTRFAEIATGSFGVEVPENLVHVDINPKVFSANWPAKVALQGDSKDVLPLLLAELKSRIETPRDRQALKKQIAKDKQDYLDVWFKHNQKNAVNPAKFFTELRSQLKDDAIVVADDGNHTFLTAELMPIHKVGNFISPTDYNAMGYCVPAVVGAKMANKDKQVVGIAGDGCFMMTGMEVITAVNNRLGAVFVIFNDGELSQISQAQNIPYNRKVCTVLNTGFKPEGIALATGAEFVEIADNNNIEDGVSKALDLAAQDKAVILNVRVDYSKKTRFTEGIVKTNLKRLPGYTKVRMLGRGIKRKITG